MCGCAFLWMSFFTVCRTFLRFPKRQPSNEFGIWDLLFVLLLRYVLRVRDGLCRKRYLDDEGGGWGKSRLIRRRCRWFDQRCDCDGWERLLILHLVFIFLVIWTPFPQKTKRKDSGLIIFTFTHIWATSDLTCMLMRRRRRDTTIEF